MNKKIKSNKDSSRFKSLTLLKKSSTKFPDSPEEASLETFENLFKNRDYEIIFSCPEFTSLCPVTGQPDFGEITIKYVPDKLCIESKSLKIFLYSFRNHCTFHEEAVNTILDEIVAKCSPRFAEVNGVFRPRGGIALSIKADFKQNKKLITRRNLKKL